MPGRKTETWTFIGGCACTWWWNMVQHGKLWRVNSEYAHGFGWVVVLSAKRGLNEKPGSQTLISPHSPDQENHHKRIISPFSSLPPVAMALAAGTAWAWLAICSSRRVGHAVRWRHCRVGILACQGLPSLCNARLPLNYFLAAWAKKPMSRMGYGISGMSGWASCVLQHWHAFVWKGSLSH